MRQLKLNHTLHLSLADLSELVEAQLVKQGYGGFRVSELESISHENSRQPMQLSELRVTFQTVGEITNANPTSQP